MVRSSVVHSSLLKWDHYFRLPQKLCPAYICIKTCLAAYFLTLSTIRFKTSHNLELCIIGQTGRWRFSEKAVGAPCRDVRFQLFRTVTNATRSTHSQSRTGCHKPVTDNHKSGLPCSVAMPSLANPSCRQLTFSVATRYGKLILRGVVHNITACGVCGYDCKSCCIWLYPRFRGSLF